MPDFQYKALDRAGLEVKGTVAARDTAEAAGRVRALGYFPVDVRAEGSRAASSPVAPGTAPVAAPEEAGKSTRIPRIHILLFTRELGDLIGAGLPIDRALAVLIEQSDHENLRGMVRKLQADIRAGKPLSEALTGFPRVFPELYANMVRAGEISGDLPAVITRLADFMEKEQVRRSQVVAALTYPAVLIAVAISAVTFLLTFVIPKLQDVFKDLGAALPLPTQVLLSGSGFVTHYWWAILIGGGGGAMLFRAWTATTSGRRSFDGFRLGAPMFGALTRKVVMARFTRTLGTLLGGGVPILSALEISGTAVGNVVTSEAVADVRGGVRQGETLSDSMARSGRFLPLVVHMTAVGEETGRLGQMLLRSAETLDFEVDNAMRRLTSLVEPLVVLLMGSFVGFVVLSILLPIFQANKIVK